MVVGGQDAAVLHMRLESQAKAKVNQGVTRPSSHRAPATIAEPFRVGAPCDPIMMMEAAETTKTST